MRETFMNLPCCLDIQAPMTLSSTVPSLKNDIVSDFVCRLLSSSRDSGGPWTGKTCGGGHCSHYLFPCCSHSL